MNLENQIQSIIVSFVCGYFSSLAYNVSYFLLYNRKIIIRILISLLYFFLLFSIYFHIMFCINSGVIHAYFIFMLIVGFIIGNRTFVKIRIDLKKRG